MLSLWKRWYVVLVVWWAQGGWLVVYFIGEDWFVIVVSGNHGIISYQLFLGSSISVSIVTFVTNVQLWYLLSKIVQGLPLLLCAPIANDLCCCFIVCLAVFLLTWNTVNRCEIICWCFVNLDTSHYNVTIVIYLVYCRIGAVAMRWRSACTRKRRT